MSLFAFGILLCWISVWLDLGRWPLLGECVNHLYNEWDIGTGLSLLIGYLGMGATVLLGFITLRFTFKIDERERMERFQDIRIKDIQFYDMSDTFAPAELKYNDTKDCQFLLKIILMGGSSGYELEVKRVLWGNCDEKYEPAVTNELSQCKVHIENGADTVIYIFFQEFDFLRDKDIDEAKRKNSVSYFYHIREYEPLMMDKVLRHRWIQLDIGAREKVWVKQQKPKEFMFDFEILVENKVTDQTAEYVTLSEIRHRIGMR